MKVELHFTDEAAEELTRLCGLTGLNQGEVIKKAFNLFRAYLQSRSNRDEWVVLPHNTSDIECLCELLRVTVPGIKEC